MQQVLAEERLHRLVEELKGATAEQAAAALRAAGPAAIPPLLDALQRRDAELRCQAHRLLQQLLQRPLAFDPLAPEGQRQEQLARLHEQLARKAS